MGGVRGCRRRRRRAVTVRARARAWPLPAAVPPCTARCGAPGQRAARARAARRRRRTTRAGPASRRRVRCAERGGEQRLAGARRGHAGGPDRPETGEAVPRPGRPARGARHEQRERQRIQRNQRDAPEPDPAAPGRLEAALGIPLSFSSMISAFMGSPWAPFYGAICSIHPAVTSGTDARHSGTRAALILPNGTPPAPLKADNLKGEPPCGY